ncbi:MAG: AMP-binding protein [Promethearchaeota archaeon]|jgi:crotonobetaine/carnitine-CoA ligase
MQTTKKFRLRRNTILRDVVKHKAETVGDRVFMTYLRDFDNDIDEKYTYKDMHLMSNRLANGLLTLGLKKGDGVALMEINSPEFLSTVFATFKAGMYSVMVNISLRGEGLAYIIDHSDASAVIIHWSFLNAVLDIRSQLPKIKHVIVDTSEAPGDFKLPEGTISFQEVMKASDDDIDIEIGLDDMCMLMYTAGTTGLPKAIMFWQGRLLLGINLQTFISFLSVFIQPDDVLFTSLPLFHSNALFLTTLPAYFGERPLILGKRFSASRHWDICRKYNVTTFNTLGAMIPILMKQPERSNDKEHKVRRVSSAACPRELWVAFEERYNLQINEGYGATDGGGFSLGAQGATDVPVGSMGKSPTGAVAGIMDDNGAILEESEKVGELVFLVKEMEVERRQVKYYKDEEASKSLIREGKDGQKWFHTGDLAYKDSEGWFFFVDRKKDSIRRRGENIAAFSIEKVINLHDKVLESAAFGVKSELGEDEVMVAVVMKPGESMTPEELLDFCQGKMAYFMIPRYIDFVEKLPKSEVHRIMHRFLKETGITETTYDREKAGYEIKRD